MQVNFSNFMQSVGLDSKVLNSVDSGSKFSNYLSSVKSSNVKKIDNEQNKSLGELKNIMECQIKLHDLSMKVELVSRVAEAGVNSVRKLQNGI